MGPDEANQSERREIRLALTLNGGVSLAIWIGGVANEVLRLCRGAEPYAEFLEKLSVKVRADVLTGASAGGLNAVFLALGQLYEREDLRNLREVWVDRGAFDQLLRSPLKSDAPSLMRGDDYFLVELRRALASLMDPDRPPKKSLDINVRLTVTSLNGEVYEHPDDFGGVLRERGHGALIQFDAQRDDFAYTEPNIDRLARACRSTASFPGAFEPSFVRARREDTPSDPESRPQDDGAFRVDRDIEGIRSDRFLLDGGVLVNLPVGPAIEAIFNKGARGDVSRILALVIPDPSMSEVLPPDEMDSPPGITAVIGASASGIPRTQSVRGFLEELRSHNDEVEIIQQQRLALLSQTGGARALREAAQRLFEAYRSGRLAGGASQAGEELSDLVEDLETFPLPSQVQQWHRLINELFRDPGMSFRWIPENAAALDSPSGWGGSVVVRSCGRLLHLLGAVGAEGDAREALKVVIHAAREVAIELGSKDSSRILGGKRPIPDVDEYRTILREHLAMWPGSDEELESLGTMLRWLGAAAEVLSATAIGQGLTVIEGKEFVNCLPGPLQGVSFLLALEVVECAFGDFEDFIEQRVNVAQIDSVSPAPIDPLRRSSQQKVAGIQLGHFGAFLKRAWRANDWMWGRVDGVTHLCRLLVLDEASSGSRPALAAAVGLEEDAKATDIADAWATRIQAEIVADELPKVADAVRTDRDLGGASGTFSTQFLSAYEASQDSSRDGRSEEDLVTLLSAERIGEERLIDELGSDLVTRTSVHSLATGATVLQQGSPKMLRSAVAAVRYVALLAWGITRTAAGRSQLLNAIAAVFFGAGLAGVAAILFTDADLGVFALPAWVAFGAGLLLALARAPVIVVPTLLLVLIPQTLVALPEEIPKWWEGPPWPAIHGWDWLPTAGFILAGLIVGLARRPAWLTGFRRHTRERMRALDSTLRGTDT